MALCSLKYRLLYQMLQDADTVLRVVHIERIKNRQEIKLKPNDFNTHKVFSCFMTCTS